MTYDFRKEADDAQEPKDPIDVLAEYNQKLAKLCQKLKKDAGAETIQGNYKGTGRQRFRRQVFVRFKSGAFLDLWLENDRLEFGGVAVRSAPGQEAKALQRGVPYKGRTPEEVYKEVAQILNAWAN